MTDDEIKEACRRARGWLDDENYSECVECGEMAGGCSECLWSRALLAVVAQRDEARGEIDRMTSRLAKSNGQRDAARDLHEKAMTMIHDAAGVARNGMCGILAFIDNAKEAEQRGYQRALDEVVAYANLRSSTVDDETFDEISPFNVYTSFVRDFIYDRAKPTGGDRG